MELRDFLVTPIIIMLVYGVAYIVRPYCTDEFTRRYYFPALTLKLLGAISMGLIYQFYYGSGDTLAYHTGGSRYVWEALVDSPTTGLKLFFAGGKHGPEIFKYSSSIIYFRDANSYTIVQIATLFDLLTYSTYSATAVLFGVLAFIGSWQFYLTFYKQYPHLHRNLAIGALFVPSVVFWGSGILKDTITLACLGIATYQFYKIIVERNYRISTFAILLVSLWLIFSVKKFILQAYLPAVIVWAMAINIKMIRSQAVRIFIFPIVLLVIAAASYFSVLKIGEDDKRYALNRIARTAQVTAYDIRYWTGRDAGSGYSLGELDGSVGSMVRLAPAAINVSLFRPYLWEIRNPLMLLSALESLTLLIFVLGMILRGNVAVLSAFKDPNVVFTMIFSLVFAFAVGVSTFNFGTLARYKIPLLPFFIVSVVLINNHVSRNQREINEQSAGY
jgi:hypothetical protein